ncbi:MAG: glycosyltransferase [Nocardioides sp.]|nr:glycosyltransferase [Nocardioides sp.]
MRSLRVTLVAECFYPAVDGTTTMVKAVADRLVDTGHTVEIIAPGPGLASYRGCAVRRISPLSGPGAQVRDALAAFVPDAVQVTGAGSIATLGRKALKYARRQQIRSVVVQTSPVADLLWDQWRAKVADRAARVLVTAPWLVDTMARQGAAVDLWLPGVDTSAFSPGLRDSWLHDSWARARAAAGPLVVVGYVGSLHKRHGVRRLAELADLPGTRLVVVGDGPQRGWLQHRLPGARFVGELGTGDLAVAMSSLDVLVHPGEQETCCHALREAAASGVPVVAPRSGGAGDLVRSLETGLLYDPAEPGGLVRAVSAVVRDRHRALMGVHARDLATARTWRDAVDELVLEHLRHLPSDDPLLASSR